MVSTARCTRTTSTTLEAALSGIRGGRWKDKIATVRRAANPSERRARKLHLPGVMFSGTFDRRRSDALNSYSQLLCLDIDHTANLSETRERVIADPHTMAAFISPSGEGLKTLLQLTNDAPALHGQVFDGVAAYYWRQLNIEVDRACRDLARLCFVSHDPQLYTNLNATPFECYIDHIDNTDHTDNTSNEIDTADAGVIIEKTQPRQPGERHRCVFNLARGLRFDAGMEDATFSDLKPYVRKWFEMAKPQIATQDFSETWSDFVHAWPRAKSPLSNTPLDEAFAAALSGTLPTVCDQYDGQAVKALLAACCHLRGQDGSFYLSTHAAGARLHIKPMQVLRYLRMFEADGIMTPTTKGNRNRATVYQWNSNKKGQQ